MSCTQHAMSCTCVDWHAACVHTCSGTVPLALAPTPSVESIPRIPHTLRIISIHTWQSSEAYSHSHSQTSSIYGCGWVIIHYRWAREALGWCVCVQGWLIVGIHRLTIVKDCEGWKVWRHVCHVRYIKYMQTITHNFEETNKSTIYINIGNEIYRYL